MNTLITILELTLLPVGIVMYLSFLLWVFKADNHEKAGIVFVISLWVYVIILLYISWYNHIHG